MKILVCGGRKYKDRKYVWKCLTKLNEEYEITECITGGCSGADELAHEWACLQPTIRPRSIEADWNTYGLAAGPIRNKKMLDMLGEGDLVIAFPGNKGTADMVNQAKKRGDVIVIEL